MTNYLLGFSRERKYGMVSGGVLRTRTIDLTPKEDDPNTNKNHAIQNNTLKSNTSSFGITALRASKF